MADNKNTALWGPGIAQAPVSSDDVLLAELRHAAADPRPGTYVVYSYCVSMVFVSFKRQSGIKFVPHGSSRVVAGLPYLLISLCLGWWGIPWGIAWTIQSITECLGGGRDLTPLLNAVGSELGVPQKPPLVPMTATEQGASRPGGAAGADARPPAVPAADAIRALAARDSEGIARVILMAWRGDIAGKEFAETVLSAVANDDVATCRNAIAMLLGASGAMQAAMASNDDPELAIENMTAYGMAVGPEVAARLRPLISGDRNASAHLALLFRGVSAEEDVRWAVAIEGFDRMPGWQGELRQVS